MGDVVGVGRIDRDARLIGLSRFGRVGGACLLDSFLSRLKGCFSDCRGETLRHFLGALLDVLEGKASEGMGDHQEGEFWPIE
jgi:hypothetical protein